MNIKKIGSGLVVAISMLAFNAAAQADCMEEIDYIQQAADNLRCSDDDGNGIFWEHAPIWQYAAGKGKNSDPGDGCEVHQKLARLLYEKPVVKANGKIPAKQGSRGAARALEDHQYAYAIDLLTQFESSVDSSVVNTTDFPLLPDGILCGTSTTPVCDAAYWAAKARDFATDMKTRIDPVAGCS
ncbi:MAG: hypothetical protein OEO82_00510 [Gammaproteobacteria bacterium]|nr:hypothetical protein [Gammaproteobacteria bacterium]